MFPVTWITLDWGLDHILVRRTRIHLRPLYEYASVFSQAEALVGRRCASSRCARRPARCLQAPHIRSGVDHRARRGIGANASVYSTLRAMVLHPLAVRELDRILVIGEIVPRTGWEGNVAPANYRDLVQRSAVFERLAGFQGGGWDANVTGDGTPERLEGYLVTPTFFSLLGTRPLMGAVFPEAEAGIGSIREAVISYSTWQNHFGADPHILGRTFTLNGSPVVICAVMPREFDFPTGAEIWAPRPLNASE